ncbi:hypothetical protein MJ585_22565 [Klebsiella pneumoniae]|nr:hypothetical protein MJ585_22565 [Klebsiella pneumoniae]
MTAAASWTTFRPGEAGTNIGGMLEHVRQTMAELTNKPAQEIRIPGSAGR